MLKIRLQRIGKRGQAYFRLVLTEHTKKPQGKYLELLGSYDPHKKILEVIGDRIKYWLSNGAKLSPTAHNLLIDKGIIEGVKVKSWKPKKKARLPDGQTEDKQREEKPREATVSEPETEKVIEKPPKEESVKKNGVQNPEIEAGENSELTI